MCEICKNPYHDKRCPNYSSDVVYPKCFLCNEEIEAGEEYIEGYNGNLAHLECCDYYGLLDLLKFLEIKIEKMEEL